MNIEFQLTNIATIGFDFERNISASREYDEVTLNIPLLINLTPEAHGSTWSLHAIHLEIFAVLPKGAERRLCSSRLTISLQSRRTPFQMRQNFAFRCTPRALAEFERTRDGDGVSLRLKFTGTVHELEPGSAHRRMLCEPNYLFAQEDFNIPQDTWTSALRSVRLSASILVEIPFPIDGGTPDEAIEALSSALSSFENGGTTAWKDSVGHLRPYLEKWAKAERTPQQEPKDGSTLDRKWKLLNARDALYKCCHLWVHEPAAQCGRNDALFALVSFAGLLKSYRSE